MRQNLNKRADQQAREEYERRGINFDERLDWHMKNGFVINVPYLFATGYFYEDGGKSILFISCAAGQIEQLLRFDLNYLIDFVEFERNFSGKRKRYDYEKFKARIK